MKTDLGVFSALISCFWYNIPGSRWSSALSTPATDTPLSEPREPAMPGCDAGTERREHWPSASRPSMDISDQSSGETSSSNTSPGSPGNAAAGAASSDKSSSPGRQPSTDLLEAERELTMPVLLKPNSDYELKDFIPDTKPESTDRQVVPQPVENLKNPAVAKPSGALVNADYNHHAGGTGVERHLRMAAEREQKRELDRTLYATTESSPDSGTEKSGQPDENPDEESQPGHIPPPPSMHSQPHPPVAASATEPDISADATLPPEFVRVTPDQVEKMYEEQSRNIEQIQKQHEQQQLLLTQQEQDLQYQRQLLGNGGSRSPVTRVRSSDMSQTAYDPNQNQTFSRQTSAKPRLGEPATPQRSSRDTSPMNKLTDLFKGAFKF